MRCDAMQCGAMRCGRRGLCKCVVVARQSRSVSEGTRIERMAVVMVIMVVVVVVGGRIVVATAAV